MNPFTSDFDIVFKINLLFWLVKKNAPLLPNDYFAFSNALKLYYKSRVKSNVF